MGFSRLAEHAVSWARVYTYGICILSVVLLTELTRSAAWLWDFAN